MNKQEFPSASHSIQDSRAHDICRDDYYGKTVETSALIKQIAQLLRGMEKRMYNVIPRAIEVEYSRLGVLKKKTTSPGLRCKMITVSKHARKVNEF